MRTWLCGCLVLSSAVLCGCPGDDDSAKPDAGVSAQAGASGGGASGTAGSAGAAGSAGGAGGALGCDKDLSGTWDLIATRQRTDYTTTESGSVVLGPDLLTVTINVDRYWKSDSRFNQLAYANSGAPSLHYIQENLDDLPIDVKVTPGALSAGSIPLNLSGSWTFAANTRQISADVGATLASVIMRPIDGKVTGGKWPFPIPAPRTNTTYSVKQTEALASQFGFLGGTWQATSSSSPEGCTMRVENNTVAFECKTSNALAGTAQLTVGSNCVISGHTSTGWELSARRR